jgi:hypothetical protein
MSEIESRGSPGSKYSLRHLLTITALVAVGMAVGLAYRQNRSLALQREELLALSSRLKIKNLDELALAPMLSVADDFHSWRVYVPDGQDYELRLGIGSVSENGIPPIVGSVRIPPGQHRVTLHTGDSTSEQFRYLVFLDGVQVIENTMGGDWMPYGWSSASSIQWPSGSNHSPAPLQLAAQSYQPNLDFGAGRHFWHFWGQSDSHVTQLGYRLWIDLPKRTYQPASPFIGFSGGPQYLGIGLRDGLRYIASTLPHQWTFLRPQLATNQPVLRLEAQFITNDGTLLSSQAVQSWQVRNAASGTEPLRWQEDPAQTTHTAFLHAISTSGLQPVVEMKWDANKSDEVGIRLANSPANAQIKSWRLHILDGIHHLWRELRASELAWITPDQAINANEATDKTLTSQSFRTAVIDLGSDSTADLHLQWQTDEALPLTFLEPKDQRYAGMDLYRGLPLRLSVQIPAAMKPTLTVEIANQHPMVQETAMPGGPVFNAIRIELEANQNDWIWLSARKKESEE